MSEPLKKTQKDGTLYVRSPEIEAWLEKLEMFTPSERLLKFQISSRKSSGYVPSEVLIYFLRKAWRQEEKADFEKIFRMLYARIEQSLRSAIPDRKFARTSEIREEIMGRFAERIAKDCKEQSGLLDFFEVRFDKALVALRTSTLRKFGPAADNTEPLHVDSDHGLEISPEAEVAAADFLNGNPSKLDDPAFRSRLFAAIDHLPEDQKQVIGLLLQDLPIYSKDDNVMTISRILQCDERTVRNRRDRAYKALKAILQEEDAR